MGAFKVVTVLALSCVWCSVIGGWHIGFVSAQSAPPLPDCSNALASVVDCLSFVTGAAGIPTNTCCSGVLDLHLHRPACLCELAEDNPSTRAIPGYNPTLSAKLPAACNIQGASISECPALLGQLNATSPTSAALPPGPAQQIPGAAHNVYSVPIYSVLIVLAMAVMAVKDFRIVY